MAKLLSRLDETNGFEREQKQKTKSIVSSQRNNVQLTGNQGYARQPLDPKIQTRTLLRRSFREKPASGREEVEEEAHDCGNVTWLAAPLQTGASGPENSRRAESFLSLSGIDRD